MANMPLSMVSWAFINSFDAWAGYLLFTMEEFSLLKEFRFFDLLLVIEYVSKLLLFLFRKLLPRVSFL